MISDRRETDGNLRSEIDIHKLHRGTRRNRILKEDQFNGEKWIGEYSTGQAELRQR